MKITAIDTALLTVPTPKPMALQYPHHKLVVAQISTDEGVKGLGYSLSFNGGRSKYSPTELMPEHEKYAVLGCNYYKMKLHHADPALNASRVGAVKKALASGVRMMVDVNPHRDVLGNERQAKLLEEYDLLW